MQCPLPAQVIRGPQQQGALQGLQPPEETLPRAEGLLSAGRLPKPGEAVAGCMRRVKPWAVVGHTASLGNHWGSLVTACPLAPRGGQARSLDHRLGIRKI